MSPTFAADIVLVCLNDAGDRLAITTSDFITEVWAIDFSRRFGLPLSERRLFGSGRRPATTDMTVLAPDGKTAAIVSFFWNSPNLAERWYSFWDLETALPLADRIYIGNDGLSDGVADSVRMDASGRFLAFVESDGENKVKPIKWLQADPPPSVAEWIADLAEAIAGVALDDQGILMPVADRVAKLERGKRALAELAVAPPAKN
jgi:hypothetical protein